MNSLELLTRLISIPSVNAMGRELAGPTISEARMSDFLAAFFAEHGIQCERIPVAVDRDNVVGRLDGAPDLPTVWLDAHQDTVPVDDMTIPPFDAEVRSGRVYGRGACDVKGGMAAMLCAMQRLATRPVSSRPTVVMTCTCDEEHCQLGARELVRIITDDQPTASGLWNKLPDMIIVAEPTELNVAVAHRGVTRWPLITKGRAAHSSDPTQGENAIYRMAEVVSEIAKYADELANATAHPLCGPGALSVGRIEGGQSVNIVPSHCAIEIDRRTRPDEDSLAVIDELSARLRNQTDADFEMLPPTCVGQPLSNDNNEDVAARLVQSCSSDRPSQVIGLPFCTHAGRYAQAGVPCVVFGPGSIEQAHASDEWISIEQLEHASETLYRFCRSLAEPE